MRRTAPGGSAVSTGCPRRHRLRSAHDRSPRVTSAVAAPPTASVSEKRLDVRIREAGRGALARVGVVFLLVACTITYYGQLHRTQSGDVYGTIYTAVAL